MEYEFLIGSTLTLSTTIDSPSFAMPDPNFSTEPHIGCFSRKKSLLEQVIKIIIE